MKCPYYGNYITIFTDLQLEKRILPQTTRTSAFGAFTNSLSDVFSLFQSNSSLLSGFEVLGKESE